jgi:hypothetical protein
LIIQSLSSEAYPLNRKHLQASGREMTIVVFPELRSTPPQSASHHAGQQTGSPVLSLCPGLQHRHGEMR